MKAYKVYTSMAPQFKAFILLFQAVGVLVFVALSIQGTGGKRRNKGDGREGWDGKEELAGVVKTIKEHQKKSLLKTFLYFPPVEFCTYCNYLHKQKSVGENETDTFIYSTLVQKRLKMRVQKSIMQQFLGVVSRLVALTVWELVRNENSQVSPQA